MRPITLAAALLLAGAPSLQAEGLPIDPGMWEMKSTVTIPMFPQPQLNTMTRCLRQSTITTEDFNSEGIDPNCVFGSTQVNEQTMSWTVECPVAGGATSRGNWQATSEGDRVTGSGQFSIDLQGQVTELTVSWEARRTGDC